MSTTGIETRRTARTHPERYRSTFWVRMFMLGRRTDEWVQVQRGYTRTTAAQITSDIVNAHRRPSSSVRVRGIESGEVWDARWVPSPFGMRGDFEIWIRRVEGAVADEG